LKEKSAILARIINAKRMISAFAYSEEVTDRYCEVSMPKLSSVALRDIWILVEG